jgi:tripartite-type tricarboxylate transporter receptor subunit TctC
MQRFWLIAVAAISCATAAATSAAAQDKYPSRPIKIIGPYAPGGATDIVARVIGEQLRQSLKQAVIVENKPGAFGILAIEEMMHAKPDGYTIMVGNNTTNAVTPIMFAKKLKFDYAHEVQPITKLIETPSFVLAAKSFPVKTVPEFIAYAKQHPGEVRFGTVGVGSYPHYDMELFVRKAGIKVNHIPNKAGASALLKDILTGDVQIGSITVATAMPLVKGGKVTPLAVTGARRLPDFPDIPTMSEIGYGDVSTIQWIGFFASNAVPKSVMETLFKASTEALNAPGPMNTFKANFMVPTPSASLDDARKWQQAELAKWRKAMSEVKIDVGE